YYNIINPQIIVLNKKPELKNKEIHFSISHSKGLIAIAFDTDPVGFDIEYIKDRNLDKFSLRYRQKFNSLNEFYEFWTRYEAKIKLQDTPVFYKSFEGIKGYMFSIASKKIISDIQIIAKECM
ncbi:MAG: hypothetical protein LUE64_06570, partial [Candidatus Gastranaerophilales bacterium]|nr:hypothetical protein [Candidatus Gastranaerophilales bacterium]